MITFNNNKTTKLCQVTLCIKSFIHKKAAKIISVLIFRV